MSGTLFTNEGNSGSTPDLTDTGPYDSIGYGLSASVAANALTITLTGPSGAAISSGSPAYINFRNGTATSGNNSQLTVTSPVSLTVSSGSTLGHVASRNENIMVYGGNSSGSLVLAVITTPLIDENITYDITSEGGGGGADSRTVLYGPSALFGIPLKFLGRLVSNQVTPGTWVTAISNVSTQRSYTNVANLTEVQVQGVTAYGSTANKIVRFTLTTTNTGTGIVYADSATNGGSFTCAEAGLYAATFCFDSSDSTQAIGISYNASDLTIGVASIANAERVAYAVTSAANQMLAVSVQKVMKPGDVLRGHTAGGGVGTNSGNAMMRVIQVIKY